MKKTLKKAGAFGALSIAALGVMSASAMGFGGGMMGANVTPDEIAARQSTMFTQQAALIGTTVDEVKAAWADGKSFKAFATEKGVTKEQLQSKMKAQALEQTKTQLAALVSKGVITQAQADKRLAAMQTKAATSKIGGTRGMHGGFGGGMMGGFGL